MRYVIFDFDGTLVNTLPVAIDITNELSDKLGIKKLDMNRIEEYKRMEPKDFLKQMEVPLWKLPFFAGFYHKAFNERIGQMEIFEGIDHVLDLLSQKYKLGIVSSNSEDNIRSVLQRYDLLDKFEFIHSQPQIFGKSASLRKILRRRKLTVDDAIYVGDEARDVDASKYISLPVIAVTWGFNARNLLEKYQPDMIVDNVNQLVDAIETLFNRKKQ